MTAAPVIGSVVDSFSGAIEFIFEPQQGPRAAADQVGGLG